jgi:hypothetical protein
VNRTPSAAALAAALGLAVLAPGAAAQGPAAMLEAMPQAKPAVPANPPQSVISERYREIEVVVQEALPAAPAAKPAAPPPAKVAPPAAPKPEYRPAPQQYHSKSVPDVTVTRENPQNVNVSIRINSPGDNGPVTQTNNAGGGLAPAPATRPEPPKSAPDAAGVQPDATGSGAGASPDAGVLPEGATPSGGPPDNWEWIWTSACFGGTGGAPAAAAAARSGWVWRWSCDEDLPPPNLADAIGEIPRPDALSTLPSVAAAMPDIEELIPGLPGADRQAARRPSPESAKSDAAAGPVRRERPPPAAAIAPVAAGTLFATAPRPPIAAAAHAASPAQPTAQARPRDAGRASTILPSGDGGPAAGAASGLGGGASLLLAGWLAVLALALALVVPRLWLRRWSGPIWRLPWPRATRLERPG